MSAWCGLAGGLLEVGARLLCRAIEPSYRLYWTSRHFIWLGPLSNLLFFVGLGLVLGAVVQLWPRVVGWLGPRLIYACAILPVLISVYPWIFPEAWAFVAMGIAVQVAPISGRHAASLRRRLFWSFPLMLGVVILLASALVMGDRLKLARETHRPLPPGHAPNVLLIVLDTVRADRLSLYRYSRPTTPTLERLSQRGIRFDEARATAPWTLPSHASMFTGRWPHELGDEWLTPLRGNFPTLAGFLGDHGYATAGFVANVRYCSQETGLARGFTHYEDYVSGAFAPLRSAGLVEFLSRAISESLAALDIPALYPLHSFVDRWFVDKRKDAASINRAFLSWLSQRQGTRRPFFAFLNYLDAHAPYVLPREARYRFAHYPLTMDQTRVMHVEWQYIDRMMLPRPFINLARDCYDDCLRYLDEQLGLLLDELERRGVLDQTLVVVTSDHGEGFGEHELFDHGESLYRPEMRVPLVIVPPGGLGSATVVGKPVSLRNLPATIVDLVGLEKRSPFPGESLGRCWQNPAGESVQPSRADDPVVSELTTANPLRPNRGRSPAVSGPLISLADGSFLYIRNDKEGSEQLFDERDDPHELSDRSRLESMRPVLERFRHRLDQFRRESAPPASHAQDKWIWPSYHGLDRQKGSRRNEG
jgi:arylsulfatase A-like enzyme